jgi:hypothetical protein
MHAGLGAHLASSSLALTTLKGKLSEKTAHLTDTWHCGSHCHRSCWSEHATVGCQGVLGLWIDDDNLDHKPTSSSD